MPSHEETEQEILSPMADMLDNQTLAIIQKSEIDVQIATAKKYPRKLTAFHNTATALATQDAESADECVYALPRDGKTIEGPSARFAEIIAYAWGNCRAGARVIGEDEEFVTAMGSFADLEQNVSIAYEVRRRITNRAGKRYNADMISTTANAACSIALRNAVLKGIPKAVWKRVYDGARATIAGDIKTIDTRRNAAIKQFELMGAKREAIFAFFDIKGIDDISLDHLVTLRGIYNAIREGETSVDRAFAPKDTQDAALAEKSRANLEAIKAKYTPPVAETDPAYQEKLRAEADRQKAAVAAKYGAGQPSTAQPDTPAVPPVAANGTQVENPAPPDQPPGEMRHQSVAAPEVSAPGGAPSGGEREPGDDEWEQGEIPLGPAFHGVPNIFDPQPGKAKPRKR